MRRVILQHSQLLKLIQQSGSISWLWALCQMVQKERSVNCKTCRGRSGESFESCLMKMHWQELQLPLPASIVEYSNVYRLQTKQQKFPYTSNDLLVHNDVAPRDSSRSSIVCSPHTVSPATVPLFPTFAVYIDSNQNDAILSVPQLLPTSYSSGSSPGCFGRSKLRRAALRQRSFLLSQFAIWYREG